MKPGPIIPLRHQKAHCASRIQPKYEEGYGIKALRRVAYRDGAALERLSHIVRPTPKCIEARSGQLNSSLIEQ